MRVSINKLTGRMIESQSGGETQEHLDTLLKNAINAGYKAKDMIDKALNRNSDIKSVEDLLNEVYKQKSKK